MIDPMNESDLLPRRITALPRSQGLLGAFRLAADGCDVLFVSAPAGTDLPSHDHDTDNLGVVITGEVVVTAEGKEQRYGPGEWYEVLAGQQHAVRFDVDTVQLELRFEVGAESTAGQGRAR